MATRKSQQPVELSFTEKYDKVKALYPENNLSEFGNQLPEESLDHLLDILLEAPKYKRVIGYMVNFKYHLYLKRVLMLTPDSEDKRESVFSFFYQGVTGRIDIIPTDTVEGYFYYWLWIDPNTPKSSAIKRLQQLLIDSGCTELKGLKACLDQNVGGVMNINSLAAASVIIYG